MPEDEPGVEQEATQEAPEEASGPPTEAPVEPTEGSPPVEDSYEKRYEDLRSQYDRVHPRLNEYEQFFANPDPGVLARLIRHLPPEQQAEALENSGYELDGSDDEDDFEAEEPITRADFQAWLQQQEDQRAAFEAEEAELDEAETYFRQEVSALEKEHGDLSDEEYKYIADYASVISDEEGRPAVKDAWDHLTKAVESRHKAYLESKKAPKVELGRAGQEKIDISDDEARVNQLAAAIEAGEDTAT